MFSRQLLWEPQLVCRMHLCIHSNGNISQSPSWCGAAFPLRVFIIWSRGYRQGHSNSPCEWICNCLDQITHWSVQDEMEMNMRLLGARTLAEVVPELVDASSLASHAAPPSDELYMANCKRRTAICHQAIS